jgi:hypothetical protein
VCVLSGRHTDGVEAPPSPCSFCNVRARQCLYHTPSLSALRPTPQVSARDGICMCGEAAGHLDVAMSRCLKGSFCNSSRLYFSWTRLLLFFTGFWHGMRGSRDTPAPDCVILGPSVRVWSPSSPFPTLPTQHHFAGFTAENEWPTVLSTHTHMYLGFKILA